MNYATLRTHDVANGPGVRVSLFVSGCTHRCKGCFNAEAWDFGYGEPYTEEIEKKILSSLAPDYIKGFSLLGGEPFEPCNQKALAPLLEKIKKAYPQKSIWCYTGYDLEKDILTGRLGDKEITERNSVTVIFFHNVIVICHNSLFFQPITLPSPLKAHFDLLQKSENHPAYMDYLP